MMSNNPFAVLAESVPSYFYAMFCNCYDCTSNNWNFSRYNS